MTDFRWATTSRRDRFRFWLQHRVLRRTPQFVTPPADTEGLAFSLDVGDVAPATWATVAFTTTEPGEYRLDATRRTVIGPDGEPVADTMWTGGGR